jgi:endoglucanase
MTWRTFFLWIGFLLGATGCEGAEFVTIYPDAEAGIPEVAYTFSTSTTTEPSTSSSSRSTSSSTTTTTESSSTMTTTSSSTSTVIVVTVTSTSSAVGCATLNGQCGGMGWSGPTTCCSGAGTCHLGNPYFSQCTVP